MKRTSEQCDGVLILVVGPSGVGKDTLLDGARRAFAGNKRFEFPQRYITRPAAYGGEAHIPVSNETFDDMKRDGKFALHWSAHGFQYGISADVLDRMARGVAVIVNVSRTVIAPARAQIAPMHAVYITASSEVIAARLKVRGRESSAQIQERARRDVGGVPEDAISFVNDRPVSESIAAFTDLLAELAGNPHKAAGI